MPYQFPHTFKSCATCQHWGGNREAESYGNRLIVDSQTAKGKCQFERGPWRNQAKQASSNCSEWERWGALR